MSFFLFLNLGCLRVKRILIAFLKTGISAAILAWLFVQAQRNAVFTDLWQRPKHWGLLAGSFALSFTAVVITLVRWYYLVRALGVPVTLRQTMRVGFLGYLFNLAPMGIVGGDILKAVMLGHEQPRYRPETLASVFVDRALGLYVLFVVASGAILATRFWEVPSAAVVILCKSTVGMMLAGALAIAAALGPDLTRGKSLGWMASIPYVGRPLAKLVTAVRMYRWRLGTLALATLMSVAVHTLFASSLFLIAASLYDPHHTLGVHLVVSPISAVTGVLPVNLGPFEGVLNYLYTVVPLADGGYLPSGQGLVVALGYRIGTVLIAAVGLVYYLAARREVSHLMEDAAGELSQAELARPGLVGPDGHTA